MFLVVHHAELARRYALDKLVGVNYEAAFECVPMWQDGIRGCGVS